MTFESIQFCPLQTPFEAINDLSFSLTLESILCVLQVICAIHTRYVLVLGIYVLPAMNIGLGPRPLHI
jgi:hypothetical protein